MVINIVLIHIGSTYPKYIDECVNQLKLFNINVHLLVNEHLINYISDKNITISKIEDYINEKYRTFYIKGYDKEFRDGFWNSTTSRFFILENYAKLNNLNNFFHIEYDNLIYDNLIKITQVLSTKKESMFIVVDSENRCIPSVMFIRDYKILNDFTDFIINNNDKNDMENLYEFFSLNRDMVGNLPILPKNHNINLVSKTGIQDTGKINYSNLFDELNILFDGAALGQFVGGVDPRNDSSNTIGFINETTIFDVSKLKIIWEEYLPLVLLYDTKIKICNLHIHSKNLNNFTIKNN
jgi:hypothetical protein